MSEGLPKLLELKLLKRISKVMVLPMIIASYISQFGLGVKLFGYTFEVVSTASPLIQALQFSLLLSLNIVLISIPFWLAHNCLPVIHVITYSNKFQRSVISFAPIFPVTFGLLGFFHTNEVQILDKINHHWYYTALIIGFYFMSVEDDIDPSMSKDGEISYPKRNFPLVYWKDIF